MTRPTRIRVFGKLYKVLWKRPVDGSSGECEFDRTTIRVAPDNSPIVCADTLLHEVFHSILHEMQINLPFKTEEKAVNALATGLTGVLQDNPQFAKFLIQNHNKE